MPYIKPSEHMQSPLTDKKVNSKSWLTKMTIENYLAMIDIEHKEHTFQRNIIGGDAYEKMILDILCDSVIPTISVYYQDIDFDFNIGFNTDIGFSILDGLQRTNCLAECKKIMEHIDKYSYKNEFDNDINLFLKKEIYVEIWERLDLKSILYKMVVLNTGQKKMDYEHQLDILNTSIKATLEEQGIKTQTRKEHKDAGRDKNAMLLSVVAEGLVAYINKLPTSGKRDAAEVLFTKLNLESNNDNEIGIIYDEETYNNLFWVLGKIKPALDEKYTEEGNPFIVYDLFFISFMAALGFQYNRYNKNYSNDYETNNEKDKKRKLEISKRKTQIEQYIKESDDPFKLKTFKELYGKFTSGIGEKRRKLVFETFKEYFISSDESSEPNWYEIYERYYA